MNDDLLLPALIDDTTTLPTALLTGPGEGAGTGDAAGMLFNWSMVVYSELAFSFAWGTGTIPSFTAVILHRAPGAGHRTAYLVASKYTPSVSYTCPANADLTPTILRIGQIGMITGYV